MEIEMEIGRDSKWTKRQGDSEIRYIETVVSFVASGFGSAARYDALALCKLIIRMQIQSPGMHRLPLGG